MLLSHLHKYEVIFHIYPAFGKKKKNSVRDRAQDEFKYEEVEIYNNNNNNRLFYIFPNVRVKHSSKVAVIYVSIKMVVILMIFYFFTLHASFFLLYFLFHIYPGFLNQH